LCVKEFITDIQRKNAYNLPIKMKRKGDERIPFFNLVAYFQIQ